MKRNLLVAFYILAIMALSGCTTSTGGTGNLSLMVSDSEADIGDFDSLLVTFSEARVFRPDSGFETFSLNATVDVTQIVGEKSIGILEAELDSGTYSKIELYASSVTGIAGGEEVQVTIPSGKLQIVRPFQISTNQTTTFVFDINVVRRGQSTDYNLLPVIAKSGVVGEDLGDEDVEETECTVDQDCPSGLLCSEGDCEAPECTSDINCPSGFTCSDGECEESAGCESDDDCSPGLTCSQGQCVGNGSSLTGDFAMFVSDAQAEISDFDSLLVKLSKTRIFQSDGYSEIGLNATAVDLTMVVGEQAVSVLNTKLPAGNYTKVELYVSSVNGTVNGSQASVKVPSNKLQLTVPFTISPNATTSYVFDISVVRKGQGLDYNLLPVISESGVVGDDIPEDGFNETECTVDGDCDLNQTCTSEGVCVQIPEPECTVDANCTSNQSCVNGTCIEAVPECSSDANCTSNQSCVNGTCTDILECEDSTDCGEAETCVGNICVPSEPLSACTTDENCTVNQTCMNGTCTSL